MLEDNGARLQNSQGKLFWTSASNYSQQTVTQELRQNKISNDWESLSYVLFLEWLGDVVQEKENWIQRTELSED